MKTPIQINTHRRPAIRPCTQSLAGPGAAPGSGKVRCVVNECGESHRARNGWRNVIRAILAGLAAHISKWAVESPRRALLSSQTMAECSPKRQPGQHISGAPVNAVSRQRRGVATATATGTLAEISSKCTRKRPRRR